jgi:protein SCO1/2
MTGGILRILVVALVLLVAAMLMLPRPHEMAAGPAVATMLDTPRELPAVALTDHRNRNFSLQQLAGRPTLVFFGYTNCPDICPLTLAALTQAMVYLRARNIELPQVLFVSVDPKRDSPDRIAHYLRSFDPEFLGATASDAALAPLLETLSVTVHKEAQGEENFNVTHNGTIYVLDSSVRWAALFGGSSHQAQDVVDDYVAMHRSL